MQFALIGKDSNPDRISPSAVPQREQKQRLYLYGGAALKVAMLSRPEVILKVSDLTKAKALAPTFRHRLQWHMPIMLGLSLISNCTAPQQQLPLIILPLLNRSDSICKNVPQNCMNVQLYVCAWITWFIEKDPRYEYFDRWRFGGFVQNLLPRNRAEWYR